MCTCTRVLPVYNIHATRLIRLSSHNFTGFVMTWQYLNPFTKTSIYNINLYFIDNTFYAVGFKLVCDDTSLLVIIISYFVYITMMIFDEKLACISKEGLSFKLFFFERHLLGPLARFIVNDVTMTVKVVA